MKKLSTSLFTLFVLCLFLQCAKKDKVTSFDSSAAFLEEVKDQVFPVNLAELRSIIDTADYYILVDVREKVEHNAGYIEGSANLSRGLLEFKFNDEMFWLGKDMEVPYKEDLIIVYSRKDGRAILAAATIQKMGFTNVSYLEGGYKNWETNFPNEYARNEED